MDDDEIIFLSHCSYKSNETQKIQSKGNVHYLTNIKDSEASINMNETECISSIQYTNNLMKENNIEKELSEFDLHKVNFECENDLGYNSKKKSESDSDYESQNKIYQCHTELSFDDEILKQNYKNMKSKSKNNVNKILEKGKDKQQTKLEKQEEITKQKLLKKLNKKNCLNNNADHKLKLIEIIFDEEIKNHDYFDHFLTYAEENCIKYNVQSQLIPKSITFSRYIENHYINKENNLCSNIENVNEKHIIIIWNCKEIIDHIFDNTFISVISNIKLLVPDRKLSLIIYKIGSYFKYLKSIKDRAVQETFSRNLSIEKQKKMKLKGDKDFSNYPIISRKKFEKCLVEIQLIHNINSRLIENQDEMILWIHQYTKSLTRLPSKIEKRSELSKIDCYINCDNRDTVKVDKDGNGLKRLWQQQLCQFTLMSLETSEAISSIYKSPLHLIETYKNCSQAEGEALLKDIPIRRAAGPLTSVRKIGPELSKKIFIMFTSIDGETLLND
ncbi:PREDICTED: crossover junction endonuclease EME1-like [Ceratosolen solmsi marchali]|uniref:Crossover junction endonuclease EME1-like n=1 Tax=Ceratosolen solmsi marchali TaxID=326594 RepID=A0AAJ6YTT5_9HYME|nr:PREDICTED: crossover junction endonuclease EME1-like [Ceratosolen solmsi marchali]